MVKVQKTISIEIYHAQYIEEEGINLSSCVRDMLDVMIADKKKVEELMESRQE